MSSRFLMRALGTLLLLASSTHGSVPDMLLGSWTVGVPYNTEPPIGISARQEARLRRLRLVYTKDHLRVCGHDIAIVAVSTKHLTEDEFLQERGFLPSRIGFGDAGVVEIQINHPNAFGACGEYNDPGTDLITDDAGRHVVMEVANDYLPLKKD